MEEITTFEPLVQPNIDFIESLTPDSTVAKKYPILADYLKPQRGTCLRSTLLYILNFLKKKKPIRDGGLNSYVFWMTTSKLSEIRGVKQGDDTSNRHLNMLCCMGLFVKKPQHKNKPETLLPMVKEFLETTENIRAFGTFKIVKYSTDNLKHIEHECLRLKAAGITAGNVSYTHLCNAELKDIGDRIYYLNNRKAPEKKKDEYARLIDIIDNLIDKQGYCTKTEIKGQYRVENGAYTKREVNACDKELKKVFRDFKVQLKERYWYKPPSDDEIRDLGLKGHGWIYIKPTRGYGRNY